MKIILDADGAIAGRLGSYVAKELLKGNNVDVINCEKAIISGNKKLILDKIQRLRRMGRGGSLKGPKISKNPEKFLKRIIRGMLPWDKPKGRAVFRKLKCYIGDNLKQEDKKNIRKLQHKKLIKYLTIKQIMELI